MLKFSDYLLSQRLYETIVHISNSLSIIISNQIIYVCFHCSLCFISSHITWTRDEKNTLKRRRKDSLAS